MLWSCLWHPGHNSECAIDTTTYPLILRWIQYCVHLRIKGWEFCLIHQLYSLFHILLHSKWEKFSFDSWVHICDVIGQWKVLSLCCFATMGHNCSEANHMQGNKRHNKYPSRIVQLKAEMVRMYQTKLLSIQAGVVSNSLQWFSFSSVASKLDHRQRTG